MTKPEITVVKMSRNCLLLKTVLTNKLGFENTTV